MTRAGVAAADRKSKEKIAELDRNAREKIEKRKFDLDKKRLTNERVFGAAKATKDLVGSAALLNHPEWYKKFGADKFVSSLPTFNRVGIETMPKFLADTNSGSSTLAQLNRTLPGICVIKYVSSLPNQGMGANAYKYSPINVGLSRFMSELRKMNSRVGEYDASDFGLYWYATADYMFLIERIRVAIKAYNTYHIDNAYFAKVVIQALGFEWTDFKAHIAEYKYLVAKHIKIFNSSILLPMNLSFVQRRFWLATVIAKDHSGTNAQLYLFRPERLGVLSLDENAVNYGSTAFDAWNYITTENQLDDMKTRLVDSVGMQVMMADLRAAIPSNKFAVLQDLDASATLEISEDIINLEQIHNITTLPGLIGDDGVLAAPEIYRDSCNIHAMADGYLAQGIPNSGRTALTTPGPYFQMSQDYLTAIQPLCDVFNNVKFLNFYEKEASADDIIEATRLRSNLVIDAEDDEVYPTIRGTEVVTHMLIYGYTANGDEFSNQIAVTDVCYDQDNAAQDITAYLSLVSKFDWFPVMRVAPVTYSDAGYLYNGGFTTHGEIDKVVPISNTNLELLHSECSLSLFYVDSGEFLKRQ